MKLYTFEGAQPRKQLQPLLTVGLLIALLFGIELSISAQNEDYSYQDYHFTTLAETEATSIKNQQQTGTCWSFTTTSFLESEMIRMGKDPVDLSEMYTVRNIYRLKASTYIRRQGKTNFSEGGLSHDVMKAYRQYGAVPEVHYSGLLEGYQVHNHGQMVGALKGMIDGLMDAAKGKLRPEWQEAVVTLLDVYMGSPPETFMHNNKSYTPGTFAQEVVGINPDDYIELTSFTHVPYYKQFVLDIPDNYSNGIYYNVPLDELIAVMDHALKQGYSVAWDGDVSEKTFMPQHGLALLPSENWGSMGEAEQAEMIQSPGTEATVTAEMRQNTYNSYETTDDHLMHITGSVQDQNGTTYYRTKNSWGEIGPFDGYMFMSKAYVSLKTMGIMIHKDALPEDIREKLEL